MASVKGRSDVRSFMASLPEQLATRVLRGAARAGGKVIAAEAEARSHSDIVSENIITRTKVEDTRVRVAVTVKPGWAMTRAIWEEYGTAPHFISVDDSQRNGLGIKRINQKVKEAKGDGSLVINGKFVGATVWHPGAKPHPFLRPALDTKEADAITAAQHYITARVSRTGIKGSDEGDKA